jgi:hypothetical protein
VQVAAPAKQLSPPPTLAPIISLAEHLRRGTFTAAQLDAGITTGELFTVRFEPVRAPKQIPAFVRTPVSAMELRWFWTQQIQRWAERPRTRLRFHDGTRREKLPVAAAVLGLLDNMRHDGALRGPRGFWSVDQLAGFMHTSRTTAIAVLREFEELGALHVVPVHDERGHHQASERYMRVPSGAKPKVQAASSEVDLGNDETQSPQTTGA